ncbi:hypothetical protein PHYBOEH_001982 [Phytophthora boehmeriae]|uniref:Uncharacterized protein n=1 Tax=Phytophthora boehmeriae TaxID=109152 RepID=A0A8T1V4G4_9STRA|nr:hypothetical protein PHYBOEH_001982 [Phytophthora boehmeriae]
MPIQLSPDERERIQDLTTQLLDRTLRDRDELGLGEGQDSHVNLNSKRWKKLQSQPNLTLYADRTPDAAWIPAFCREDWRYPISVVGVGRIQCTLDDMLLAVLTPGIAAQRLRSVLMERRPEQDSEFIPIVMPSQRTPFRFIGLTRFVYSAEWPVAVLVGPREFVLACSMGEVTTANGERVGYELFQSVSRQSQIVDGTAMARSQIIEARVFWEQPDGSVLVYNKLIVDAKNRVPDKLKQRMLCHSLHNFWKFVPRCVENKKLRWCLKHKKTLIHELQLPSRAQAMIQNALNCAGCGLIAPRPQSKKVSTNQCELCDAFLCSDAFCRASCQLTMVRSSATTSYEEKLPMCLNCIAFVRSRNAADIARSEVNEVRRSFHDESPASTRSWP